MITASVAAAYVGCLSPSPVVIMPRQCSISALLAIVAVLTPASALLSGRKLARNPTANTAVMNLLFKTAVTDDAFTQSCLDSTKAFVAENDGKKKGVGAQLKLVCSGLQLVPDVALCEDYRDSLLGHLHDDAQWNLASMDYPLFCGGMEKVVAEHKAELVKLASAKKP